MQRVSKAVKQSDLKLEDWRLMKSAPKTATWVQVRLKDGSIIRAHYAEDLSGEEQPPFQGWFKDGGNQFVEVYPIAWRPIQ